MLIFLCSQNFSFDNFAQEIALKLLKAYLKRVRIWRRKKKKKSEKHDLLSFYEQIWKCCTKSANFCGDTRPCVRNIKKLWPCPYMSSPSQSLYKTMWSFPEVEHNKQLNDRWPGRNNNRVINSSKNYLHPLIIIVYLGSCCFIVYLRGLWKELLLSQATKSCSTQPSIMISHCTA